MRLSFMHLPLLAALWLAACGGGGGSPGTTTAGIRNPDTMAPTTSAAVVITELNAKPISAHAMDAAQSVPAAQATSLGRGVQIEGDELSTPSTLWLAQAARQLVFARQLAAANMPAGVTIDETRACTSGSVRITGSVASQAGLGAGDSVMLEASNCRVNVAGVTSTLNGRMTLTVTSGTVSEPPFTAVVTLTASNLSVQSGATTVVTNGSLTLDWSETAVGTSTLAAAGTSFTTRVTTGSASRNTTWKDFRQTISVSGSAVTGSLNATVETDSTRLGTNGGTYTLSTLTELRWDANTHAVTAGVLKVAGAANSQLQITFAATGTELALDANGDGTFEKTINTSTAELGTLL